MIKKNSKHHLSSFRLEKGCGLLREYSRLKKLVSGVITPFSTLAVELALEPKGRSMIFLLVDDVDEAYRTFKERGVKLVTESKDQYWRGRTVNSLTRTKTSSF